jgi:hypothetical protein
VVFDAGSTLANVTLDVSNTTLTVGTAGTYVISWNLLTTSSSGTFAVTINGTAFAPLRAGNGGVGVTKDLGTTAIVALAAGDALTLRNVSGATFGVGASTNGGGGNTATLRLMRIR